MYPFYLLPFRHTICFSQNIYRKRLSLYFKYNLSLKFIRRREEIVIPYYFSRNTRSPPKGEGPRPAEICFKTSCLSERQNHNWLPHYNRGPFAIVRQARPLNFEPDRCSKEMDRKDNTLNLHFFANDRNGYNINYFNNCETNVLEIIKLDKLFLRFKRVKKLDSNISACLITLQLLYKSWYVTMQHEV